MTALTELTPLMLDAALKSGEVILVDVREPNEFAAARIHGAVNYPLSTFDPALLPSEPSKRVVLSCAGGVRSVTAWQQCQVNGLGVSEHLAGGLRAWAAAGLPVES